MEVITSRDQVGLKGASPSIVARFSRKSQGKRSLPPRDVQFTARGKKSISLEEALQSLEPAEKDLKVLKVQMDVVADYWMGVDTELRDINRRVRELRNDYILKTKIRAFTRRWREIAQDYKRYINAVSTIHAEQARHLLFSAQYTPE
jgi:hypothetical protein